MDYRERIATPARQNINRGLTSPSASFMTGLLGLPRGDFTGDCQPAVDPAYRQRIATRRIGPIRVTGLKPALDSLALVFGAIAHELPDLHAMIGTEGMLCCRYRRVRGRLVHEPSNHSWGTAVDLTIGNVLDRQGDGFVQRGLLVLSRYFNAHGWYWGAGFPVEDAMHFEVSRERLVLWRNAGLV